MPHMMSVQISKINTLKGFAQYGALLTQYVIVYKSFFFPQSCKIMFPVAVVPKHKAENEPWL